MMRNRKLSQPTSVNHIFFFKTYFTTDSIITHCDTVSIYYGSITKQLTYFWKIYSWTSKEIFRVKRWLLKLFIIIVKWLWKQQFIWHFIRHKYKWKSKWWRRYNSAFTEKGKKDRKQISTKNRQNFQKPSRSTYITSLQLVVPVTHFTKTQYLYNIKHLALLSH